MMKPSISSMAAGVLLATTYSAEAAGARKLEAVSTTAMAITGDVQFTAGRITFANGSFLRLRSIAGPHGFLDKQRLVDAQVYAVEPPADLVMLNGNRLCGESRSGETVTYVFVRPSDLGGLTTLAFSHGDSVPKTIDDTCGTFNYEPG